MFCRLLDIIAVVNIQKHVCSVYLKEYGYPINSLHKLTGEKIHT